MADRSHVEMIRGRRSHVPFKGARRDSVIYSLLPGELLLQA
jgi:hypothetical protein